MRNTSSWFSILPLLLLCGCGSTPLLSPALVQQGVSASVAYGALKYPNAIPFVRAAEPIVCSASEGTNLAPAEVVAAIQEAGVLQNPESVFIVNAALLLYSGVYNSYGSNAVHNSEQLREYLRATCLGIGQGLPPRPLALPVRSNWPQIRWP